LRRKPWDFPKRRWRFGKRRSRPVSRVLSWTVIPLGATSPLRSSNLPGPDAGRAMRSLFGLAPGGVCRAGPLPDSRCALTAPFHPCRPAETVLGGIFLLHFPSARAAQALPGTVPCGARTFLGIVSNDATVWPAPPRALSHSCRPRPVANDQGNACSNMPSRGIPSTTHAIGTRIASAAMPATTATTSHAPDTASVQSGS
jgi:hypothetical protein